MGMKGQGLGERYDKIEVTIKSNDSEEYVYEKEKVKKKRQKKGSGFDAVKK
jgi:hypothetical protein